MDKTAIEHIQQTAIDANKFRLPPALQDIAVAIPDNYDIRNLESFYTLRSRFRGEMKTQSITDFVQYIKTKGNGEGFINAENLSAKIFFNLGTTESPGHGDWTATLTLNATAAYKALLDIDGKTLNQRKLIDFLEDWAPLLSATSQESLDELPLTTAINAIRKLTIKKTSESESTQGEFNTSRSKFDDIEAKSAIGLPIGFTFRTQPYLDYRNADSCYGCPYLPTKKKKSHSSHCASYSAKHSRKRSPKILKACCFVRLKDTPR